MIRLRQIKINIDDYSEDNLKEIISSKLKIAKEKIISYKINKKSIDARKKPSIYFIFEVDVNVENERGILSKVKSNDIFYVEEEKYIFPSGGKEKHSYRPIIVGSGPAGLFCAYFLAKSGFKPLIIERGEALEDRIKTVEKFFESGKLNQNSNVQFGEGGAGTFSDGKLNTLIKDPLFRKKKVLEIFVECGAKSEILYENKPHIGTDVLIDVVKNIRNKIISMGGEFLYNAKLTNINIKSSKVVSIEINNKDIIPVDILVLAIGHSARDTFEVLLNNKLNMESKPFAVGVRVEHPQNLINKSQYGDNYSKLPNASYKLTYNSKAGRGVYSFCMCPGGYVVNASSEDKMLCVNGMSYSNRDSNNANSAIIVTVTKKDFGENPLDGIKFQRELEKKAYEIGNGMIPVQLFDDFMNNKITKEIKDNYPLTKGKYCFANLNEIFPKYINESLKEAIVYFDKQIKGFSSSNPILSGVESRTSSPIKILRDENFESNILGIYPCGEGAGYAGGITSSAIDGIKVAESISKKYINI